MRTTAYLCAMLLTLTFPVRGIETALAMPCAADGLSVVAEQAFDGRLACEGGWRALAFLSGLGFLPPANLTIEVVDQLPRLYGGEQLGSFDARSGRVRVLSYASCDRLGHDDLLFQQPLGPELYRSLVAHEVAHAVFDANFNGDGPRIVAQEYIAYTTQFAAMSEALRTRILAASSVGAFEDEYEMSAMRYFFSPQAFGIAAYRHFMAQPDGSGFVWRLLRGEVEIGTMPEY